MIDATRVIRPSLRGALRYLVFPGAALWLAALGAQLLAASARGAETFIATLIALGAAVVACFAAALYYVMRARIDLDDSLVTVRMPWGRSRSVRRAEVGGIALRDIRISGVQARSVFLIFDDAHECRALFDRRVWPADSIRTLAEELGVPLPRSRTTTYKALEAEFPNSVAGWHRHPWLIAWGIVLLPVFVVIAVHS